MAAAIYAHRQLLRVRVEPSDKMIAGSDNTQQQLVCTLFFDVQNSAPKGTEFSVGQKIVWNGREMTVMRADGCMMASGCTTGRWDWNDLRL